MSRRIARLGLVATAAALGIALAVGVSPTKAVDPAPSKLMEQRWVTCYTDAEGKCAVTHALGAVPAVVQVTSLGQRKDPRYTVSVVPGSATLRTFLARAASLTGQPWANRTIKFRYLVSADPAAGVAPTTTNPTTTTTKAPATTSAVPTTTTSSAPTTTSSSTVSSLGSWRNRPAQPSALVYSGDGGPNMSAYARPGALVAVGRSNYRDRFALDLAAGGAAVIAYLDPLIDNAYGRYADKLINASEFGPAVARWPNKPAASQWGRLIDFRVGSVLQQKFPKVLQLMLDENPHLAGWFLDDLGTRSWYPGLSWQGDFTAQERAEYRAGAIALAKSARQVANDNGGKFFVVNGTWTGNDGGGYPDATRHGCSLCDGGVIENHPADAFWRAYAASPQWGSETPRGLNYMWTLNTNDPAGRRAMVSADIPAYAMSQVDYATAEAPWGGFSWSIS